MAEIEKLHADALAEVVTKLKESTAVKVFVPDQIFGPDDEAKAAEWQRCLIVHYGRNYGPDNPKKNLLVQRDVKIEVRAETEEVLGMMMEALVKTLNGAVGKSGFKQCIHSNSGHVDQADGHWSRKDVFALHCQTSTESPAERILSVVAPKKKPIVAPPPRKTESA